MRLTRSRLSNNNYRGPDGCQCGGKRFFKKYTNRLTSTLIVATMLFTDKNRDEPRRSRAGNDDVDNIITKIMITIIVITKT